MNNKYILIMMMLVSSCAYSQVGIKTTTPKAALHVDGNLQMTKELLVGGTATTAGNAGTKGEILTSQGVGLPPKWKKGGDINIPQVVNMATRDIVASYPKDQFAIVKYNAFPKTDPAYLTYDLGEGKFTVVKAGYYLMTGYLEYEVIPEWEDGIYKTDGTARTTFYLNGYSAEIASSNSAHPNGVDVINHSLSGLRFLNAGDVVTLQGTYTRKFKMRNSSVSFMYLGN